jgi:hypothetical protein
MAAWKWLALQPPGGSPAKHFVRVPLDCIVPAVYLRSGRSKSGASADLKVPAGYPNLLDKRRVRRSSMGYRARRPGPRGRGNRLQQFGRRQRPSARASSHAPDPSGATRPHRETRISAQFRRIQPCPGTGPIANGVLRRRERFVRPRASKGTVAVATGQRRTICTGDRGARFSC